MSLGKSSIKRASAASKKKTADTAVEAVAAAVAAEAVEKVSEEVVEAVKAPAKRTRKKVVTATADVAEEGKTKFISKEIKDERKDRPVRLTEEMPTYLL